MLSEKILKRIGEIGYNKQGSKMMIVECISLQEIVVKFEDGYTKNALYGNFKKGKIANPYDKTVHGIGCVGEGKYITRIGENVVKQYIAWKNMLQRCYTKKYLVHCNDEFGVGRSVGAFHSPEEAFYAYKKYKENVIKLVAEQYKEFIPEKLYNALYNWKIEIID